MCNVGVPPGTGLGNTGGRNKAKDLCWMPVVFGPSDDTASLIGMILSLTLLNGPSNTSRNHCR